MRALFQDAAGLEHGDAVAVPYGGQAVSDNERRAARHQRQQGRLTLHTFQLKQISYNPEGSEAAWWRTEISATYQP